MAALKKKTKRRWFLATIDLPAILAILCFAGLIFFYLIPALKR
jgi:hypothetical protein